MNVNNVKRQFTHNKENKSCFEVRKKINATEYENVVKDEYPFKTFKFFYIFLCEIFTLFLQKAFSKIPIFCVFWPQTSQCAPSRAPLPLLYAFFALLWLLFLNARKTYAARNEEENDSLIALLKCCLYNSFICFRKHFRCSSVSAISWVAGQLSEVCREEGCLQMRRKFKANKTRKA